MVVYADRSHEAGVHYQAMTVERFSGCIALAWILTACAACGGRAASTTTTGQGDDSPGNDLRDPREVHLANLVQLTRDQGENAEAYWSFSGQELIFQSSRAPHACDQIYRMSATSPGAAEQVSSGKGRTTCAYFMPGDEHVVYASTHSGGDECPAPPDHSQGYVWPLFADYEIYQAKRDGSELRNLTDQPGYDAEATVCPVDGSIIFTSTRDGDLELYRMDADGGNVVRLTFTPGYDGGAFFSQDCEQIVWRASRPQGAELEEYKALLDQNLVRPGKLELFVANADGSDARQVTHLGAASFAPYLHPSGQRILFSTNYGDAGGREFDIWAIDTDGTDLERITFSPGFDGFPMFSPDGRKLAFASNRGQAKDGQTDVFVADWVEGQVQSEPDRAADRVHADIVWLAADDREGRGIGTQGIDAAADWLGGRFEELGAQGGMKDGSFFQSFEAPTAVTVGKGTVLTIGRQRVPDQAFVPLGFSAQGKVSGRTVAVGHGVVAKRLDYDDYGRRSVKGKVVVVQRFTPKGAPFDSPELERAYGDIHRKAKAARERGAVALIVVDAAAGKNGKSGKAGKDGADPEAPLPRLEERDLSQEVGIPVIAIEREYGQKLLAGSFPVAISVDLEVVRKPTRNVVGVIRAGQGGGDGAVIIGAHYDHLGFGGADSLEPDQRAPHNGADDNASGTAALIEIGRQLAEKRDQLARDVYLVGFSAEERGLVGSKYFVSNLPEGLSTKSIAAMINLDMVGRMRKNRVAVLGTDTADGWQELVAPACMAAGITCDMPQHGGFGPSDHSSFYTEGVPILYLTTGNHTDYHKTTDDTECVHAGGTARIALATAGIALAVANRDERLVHKQVAPALPMGGDRRSFNASLGTIPNYVDDKPGVLLDGARPGGAAHKAGLAKGDRIVRIGNSDVRNVRELMYVLQDASPGQSAEVVYMRGGKTMKTLVTFQEGRRPSKAEMKAHGGGKEASARRAPKGEVSPKRCSGPRARL